MEELPISNTKSWQENGRSSTFRAKCIYQSTEECDRAAGTSFANSLISLSSLALEDTSKMSPAELRGPELRSPASCSVYLNHGDTKFGGFL